MGSLVLVDENFSAREQKKEYDRRRYVKKKRVKKVHSEKKMKRSEKVHHSFGFIFFLAVNVALSIFLFLESFHFFKNIVLLDKYQSIMSGIVIEGLLIFLSFSHVEKSKEWIRKGCLVLVFILGVGLVATPNISTFFKETSQLEALEAPYLAIEKQIELETARAAAFKNDKKIMDKTPYLYRNSLKKISELNERLATEKVKVKSRGQNGRENIYISLIILLVIKIVGSFFNLWASHRVSHSLREFFK